MLNLQKMFLSSNDTNTVKMATTEFFLHLGDEILVRRCTIRCIVQVRQLEVIIPGWQHKGLYCPFSQTVLPCCFQLPKTEISRKTDLTNSYITPDTSALRSGCSANMRVKHSHSNQCSWSHWLLPRSRCPIDSAKNSHQVHFWAVPR